MPAPGLGGGISAPTFGEPGGGEPWQYLPATGYCGWMIRPREGGCGTGGDYCWQVGHGSAFGPGTISVFRRAFGQEYVEMGSNLYMGTQCSPGTIHPVDYQTDVGAVVFGEQCIVAVMVAFVAFSRLVG